MTAAIIRYEDHAEVSWNNGLGVTREVANAHGDDGAMLWRISLATIDRDGPFSNFAGSKRIQILLSGPGLTLDFGEHGNAFVGMPRDPVVFDGGWPTTARKVTAVNKVLNVVTLRSRIESSVALVTVSGESVPLETGHDLQIAYVLEGAVHAHLDGQGLRVSTGEALRMDGPGVTATLASVSGDAQIYMIHLDFI